MQNPVKSKIENWSGKNKKNERERRFYKRSGKWGMRVFQFSYMVVSWTSLQHTWVSSFSLFFFFIIFIQHATCLHAPTGYFSNFFNQWRDNIFWYCVKFCCIWKRMIPCAFTTRGLVALPNPPNIYINIFVKVTVYLSKINIRGVTHV